MASIAENEATVEVEPTFWAKAVQYVSDQAHHKLPKEFHGRIEMGTHLVLAGKVHHLDGEHWMVEGSQGEQYTCNSACDCEDYARDQAPVYKGRRYCKHKLAQMLQVRALEVTMDDLTWDPDELASTDDDDWPSEEDGGRVPAPVLVSAPGTALPEAAFSLTLKGQLDGVEALLTVRGQTPAEFQANLATIRGMLTPLPLAPARTPSPRTAAPAPVDETPVCQWHGAMKPSTKAAGTWYCPSKMGNGDYCKARFPDAA